MDFMTIEDTQPRTLAQIIEEEQQNKNSLAHRLITGFAPFGFSLVATDDWTIYEFKKPDSAMRFIIKGGEGGVFLIWTELEEFNFMSVEKYEFFINIPDGISCDSFSDSEEFWQKISDLVGVL